MLKLCLQHNTLFIVNDDVNLCKKIGADGVHLGQNDVDVSSARSLLGKKFIIGVLLIRNSVISNKPKTEIKKWMMS